MRSTQPTLTARDQPSARGRQTQTYQYIALDCNNVWWPGRGLLKVITVVLRRDSGSTDHACTLRPGGVRYRVFGTFRNLIMDGPQDLWKVIVLSMLLCLGVCRRAVHGKKSCGGSARMAGSLTQQHSSEAARIYSPRQSSGQAIAYTHNGPTARVCRCQLPTSRSQTSNAVHNSRSARRQSVLSRHCPRS